MYIRSFLYVLVTAFITGVLIASFTNFGLWCAAFLLLLGCGVLFVNMHQNTSGVAILAALFLFAAGLGVLRFDVAASDTGDPKLDERVGSDVAAVGIVVDEPDERQEYTRLTVKLTQVEGVPVESKALVTTRRYPEIAYGDEVYVEAELTEPDNFQTDNGRTFNYVAYLAKDGIHYTMPFAEVDVRSHDNGNIVKALLYDVKHAFLENIRRVLPEPHASLLGGLVVGANESFSETLDEEFRRTGIIHIVVLSGYNVTIVAEAIMRFFTFLPIMVSSALGAVAIVFFAILTGASATIVRASIMALLVIAARVWGNTHHITRALFVAGLVMVLHNPYIVGFDPSFQLSFIATLGLIWLSPLIEEKFHLVPTTWGLREFATATIATQLFVLPLLLYLTGQLSLTALPTNIAVLAFVPVTMLLGFITGIVVFFSVVAAMPFAFFTYLLLTYELSVIHMFASIPFSAVIVPSFPFVFVVLAYSLYGIVLWLVYTKRNGSSDV